jgi:hypothetical protein
MNSPVNAETTPQIAIIFGVRLFISTAVLPA